MVSYCAMFDTDPTYQTKCKTAIINSFSALWTPHEFPNGSWPQMYYSSTSWSTGSSATLTNGSATVTGVGPTGWAASAFPSRIWFTNSTTGAPANNSAGDPVSYSATFVDSTRSEEHT